MVQKLRAEGSENPGDLVLEFNFEKLDVLQDAINLAENVYNAVPFSKARSNWPLINQLWSAANSVALNIAEGKGRYSKKEFVQFLYIARGSLYETITALRMCQRIRLLEDDKTHNLLKECEQILRKLSGLTRAVKAQGSQL